MNQQTIRKNELRNQSIQKAIFKTTVIFILLLYQPFNLLSISQNFAFYSIPANLFIYQMYIDSPNFPRRKVFNNNSYSPQDFGFQRAQLANYVSEELNNNHRDDAAILEKFRKQAEEYKRNLLRRKHQKFNPEPKYSGNIVQQYTGSPIINARKAQNPQYIAPQVPAMERIPTSYSRKNEEINTQQRPVIIREVVQVPETVNSQLVRIIKKKDKQLEKQAEKIKRSEQKINDLKKKIQIIEHENRIRQNTRIALLQNSSIDRIKGYISSMSEKIKQNESILGNGLPQKRMSYNVSEIKTKGPSKLDSPKIPIKKTSSELNASQYSKPELKVKYSVKDRNEMNRLNSYLGNLQTSRNRLDALTNNL